jgi:hypothetical protein
VLVVRVWGVVVDCRRSPFVGGGLLCLWALVAALFVGGGRRVVVSGWWARSRAVHIRGWGAIDREQVVRGCLRFVGGGLLCPWVVAALFVGAGLLFVGAEFFACGARSWVGCSWVVVCGGGGAVSCVIAVSEIGWDEANMVLTMINNINKNNKRQHRCRSSFVSTSLSATWHLETPTPSSHRCGRRSFTQ